MSSFDRLYLNIGAMKAGTTWLYRQLQQHPDIVFSREKELHFHARHSGDRKALDLRYRVTRAHNALGRVSDGRLSREGLATFGWYVPYVLLPPQGNHWYRRRFPQQLAPAQYCADFSNLTATVNDGTWENIASLATTLKVTYMLRHPLGRLWSHLKFLYQLGSELAPVETLSPQELIQLDSRYSLWRHSQYSDTISAMRRHLAEDEVQLLFYDDIRARPAGVLEDIEAFLGIPHHGYAGDKLARRINESKAMALPEVVMQTFAQKLAQEIDALQKLGIQLPASWG